MNGFLILAWVLGAVFSFLYWQKCQVESMVKLHVSSGDNEVMEVYLNFLKSESVNARSAKLAEHFNYVDNRRAEVHAKFLEIKAKAILENIDREKAGEKLTMTDKGGSILEAKRR